MTIGWVSRKILANTVAGLVVLAMHTQLLPELIWLQGTGRQQRLIVSCSIALERAVIKFDRIGQRAATRMQSQALSQRGFFLGLPTEVLR